MKNKILTFVIGILIGAIVATLGWCIYIKSKNMNINNPRNGQIMNNQFNGERLEMPQNMEQDGGTIPPEIPTT